jgi:hypothetical protein
MEPSGSTLKQLPLILGIILLFLPISLLGQVEEIQNLEQFLFPEFTKSVLKMKAGKDITLMVFLQKDQVFDMLNQQNVDTVLMNSKIFIPSGKIFLELLLSEPVSLYIQNKGSIQDPGKPAAYGGTSQASSSTYISRLDMGSDRYNMKLPEDLIIRAESVYWITINDTRSSFVNERQFLKIFPGKEGEIKKYIKQNRMKFENPNDIIGLVRYATGPAK